MFKNVKMILSAVPFLLMAAAGSAGAATLNHPDGEGGCGSSSYWDDNYVAYIATSFEVPAMSNGSTITVYGYQYNYRTFGDYNYNVYAEFSCNDGVLSTSNYYDYSIYWTPNY